MGSIVLDSFWSDLHSGTIKSCIQMAQIWFLGMPKNNHDVTLEDHLHDYFFEMPKNKICAILMQLLMVPLWRSDQKLPKATEPPI